MLLKIQFCGEAVATGCLLNCDNNTFSVIPLPPSFPRVAALPPTGQALVGWSAAQEGPTQQKVLWGEKPFSPGADQADASF